MYPNRIFTLGVNKNYILLLLLVLWNFSLAQRQNPGRFNSIFNGIINKSYTINSTKDTIECRIHFPNDSVIIKTYVLIKKNKWANFSETGNIVQIGSFKRFKKSYTVFKTGDWSHYSVNSELLYVVHHGKGNLANSSLPIKYLNYTVLLANPLPDD